MANQNEFHVKIKLLLDTLNLLHLRVSDRKNSQNIEKVEAQNRLFTQLGRSKPTDRLTTLVREKFPPDCFDLFILRIERKSVDYSNETKTRRVRKGTFR